MSRHNGIEAIPGAASINDEKKEATYHADVSVGVDETVQPREQETLRALKPRQISMIAIGGAIGKPIRIVRGSSDW
jgi:amino acid transporter